MAQKVHVEIVDDIDGGEATQTVPFALDGVQYEIDLSDENAQALRGEFERFIEAGTRTGGRKLRIAAGQTTAAGASSRATTTADRERNQQVRAWASANGYSIADRGRIPNEIYEAFDSADSAVEPVHVEPEPVEEAQAKPTRKRAPRKKKSATD
ncbi:histone-like nucleoid-structuring protein Lsr2 [Amycolatopsis japonica]|uniref:histone-like nucleoid-structuring protein Lsr2 n=1 Tax=Amycolatopsis japonica TaxID=208439 RepID=UPI0033E07FD2